MLRVLAVAACLAIAATAMAASLASANHRLNAQCPQFVLGDQVVWPYSSHIRCSLAKRYMKRLFVEGRSAAPDSWRCTTRSGWQYGSCDHRRKDWFFGWGAPH